MTTQFNNDQLLVVAKRENILLELAGAKKYQDKLSLFSSFALTHFPVGSSLAIVDAKNRLLATTSGEKVSEKRRFELDDYHFIITDADVDQEVQNLLKQQFARLKIKKQRNYTKIVAALALVVLFLPITRTVTSEGVAIHDANSHQISVRSPGQLLRIKVPAGRVEKGQILASIDNTQAYKLSEAQAQLRLVENQIIEQGAFSTTNINHLKFEKKRLLALVDQINIDLVSNQIIAPASGVISWKQGVLGSHVLFGQVVGAVDPVTQEYITAYINIDDWAGNNIGDNAQFITQSLDRVNGVVIEIGRKPQLIDGKLKSKVVIKLNEKVSTGTTGKVVLRGDKSTVGLWLFNKPITWLVSKL